MKKAFTMLELVFVIVVTGIVTLIIGSNFQRNTLQEAADQLISHIRYTRHLAMTDDKYMPNSEMSPQANAASKLLEANNWYLGRWQIRFSNAGGTISYLVMSDSTVSNYDGNPNASVTFSYSEVAKDTLEQDKYLIGAVNGSFDGGSDLHINRKLDLQATYGINAVSISGGGTGSIARRIIFDYLGRPYRGDMALPNATHINSPVDKLANSQITIKLCEEAPCTVPLNTANNDKEVVIAIEPETGYTHIL